MQRLVCNQYLLPHQALVVRALEPRSTIQRCLIDFPTGSGKTLTMIGILERHFEDPRAKLVILPQACVANNFYAQLLHWPNRYRDFFSCVCPDLANLACGQTDWHTQRTTTWNISNLTDSDLARIVGQMKDVVGMKGYIRNGEVRGSQE